MKTTLQRAFPNFPYDMRHKCKRIDMNASHFHSLQRLSPLFLSAGEGRGRAPAQGKRTGVEDGEPLAAHRPHGRSLQHQATVSHPFWYFNQPRPELLWCELSGTIHTKCILLALCMQTSANILSCGSRSTVRGTGVSSVYEDSA